MQASRLDPPYQFEWTVFISWIIVATAIAELETGRSASPVSRDPRAPVPTLPHLFWDRF